MPKPPPSPMSQAITCPNPARGAGRRQLRPQSPRISRQRSRLSWMCPRRPFYFPRLAHSAVALSPLFRPALSSPSPPNPCVLFCCGASASPCPCPPAACSSLRVPRGRGSSDHEHPCVEVIANGLLLWNGAQLAVDTTILSPLTAAGEARSRRDPARPVALLEARRRNRSRAFCQRLLPPGCDRCRGRRPLVRGRLFSPPPCAFRSKYSGKGFGS